MKVNPAVQAYISKTRESIGADPGSKTDFSEILKNELNRINELQLKADEAARQLITGEAEDIHAVMLAAEEARLALEMAVQVRNKLVESYQEITRMQI
ncbi:MAG TPA: flagellar hook-basal body complex protein FliE [Candidatus Atribacteria bacterium]|nr:flagellar hook-basal body complex protein FliE [Candidatus Atribacteria bacterium]HPT78049.1 flagellar hook-basal body complex protein FliE [Candidatus Atribacteria bacterium]